MAAALFYLAFAAAPVKADNDNADIANAVNAKDLQQGGLYFFAGQNGVYQPAINLGAHVEGRVSGAVARFTVLHRFRNPSGKWAEGVYAFPLPGNAAVDSLRMQVQGRVIESHIKEKVETERPSERFKKQGLKQRNIFTATLANVGPGEEVAIEIEFQQTLNHASGEYSLSLPLVIGPRAPSKAPLVTASGGGWLMRIPRASGIERLASPALGFDAVPGNPVSLTLELDLGVSVAALASQSHAIKVADAGGGRRLVTLKEGLIPADRNFVLNWRLDMGRQPAASLFSEAIKGQSYLMLMLTPPSEALIKASPREVVFVIDVSASMLGLPLNQTKEALLLALSRLRPGDKFNIIQFNGETERLFDAARPAQKENLERARVYVEGLEAKGPADLQPALQAALDGGEHKGRLRQVILISDGQAFNKNGLFETISSRLGDSRLHIIGLGPAQNGNFMDRAARQGRGAYTQISDVTLAKAKLTGLFEKLAAPALTGLQITWPKGVEAEFWPELMPDLYVGEPLTILARAPALEGKISVTGALGGAVWKAETAIDGSRQSPGIGRAWAQQKITWLEEAMGNGVDVLSARQLALRTALDHRLLSQYTSLAAIDIDTSRPVGDPLAFRKTPIHMSAGSGGLKTGDAGGYMNRAAGGVSLIYAALPANLPSMPAGLLLFGLIMLAFGMLTLAGREIASA